ncbi:MAG: hypothetical protein L6R39_004152 [Caloplaca ligustica]|nr:MAG: hypothetical protein L6R39_004152 [Caloplaca ligustica]
MSNTLPVQGSEEDRRTFSTELPLLPPLEPFSESDNPDAIALRSAISVLQIQRQQTLRDLKTLERQKKAAAADPEAFATAIAAGKIKTQPSGVLSSQPGFHPSRWQNAESSDSEVDGSDIQPRQQPRGERFEDVPGPQNVVRCPPINWAKYHVVAEPLDALHKEQRRRPLANQSSDDEDHQRADVHMIAAPYSPWKDYLRPSVTSGTQGQAQRPTNG